MFKVIPVLTPQVDLQALAKLTSQEEVNLLETKHRGPAEKFSAMADKLLFKGFGERHLCYAFYVELPVHWTSIMDSFQWASQFRRSIVANGMMIEGIISGTLDIWRYLMLWIVNDEQGQLLRDFGRLVMKTLPLNNDNDLRMLRT